MLDAEWLNSIWHPHIFFKNGKSVSFQTTTVPSHYQWMYPDKRLEYVSKLEVDVSCAMNFVKYPLDFHACSFRVESCEISSELMRASLLNSQFFLCWSLSVHYNLRQVVLNFLKFSGRTRFKLPQNDRWKLWVFSILNKNSIFKMFLACIRGPGARQKYKTKSSSYSCLQITFELQRNRGYSMINTFIPTQLIVIVSVRPFSSAQP